MAFNDLIPYRQSSEQNLHVFANSRRLTKKSSNVSPVCCTRLRKLRRSTDSFTWPSTYCWIAVMVSSTHSLCARVRPRLSTMVTVSRSCKTKGKGLYLLVSCFPVEARQAKVSVPLGPPCFEVGAPVHLQVEFWQVPLPKRERHSTGSGHSSDWKENCSQRHVKTQSHKKVMCKNSHVIQ